MTGVRFLFEVATAGAARGIIYNDNYVILSRKNLAEKYYEDTSEEDGEEGGLTGD